MGTSGCKVSSDGHNVRGNSDEYSWIGIGALYWCIQTAVCMIDEVNHFSIAK